MDRNHPSLTVGITADFRIRFCSGCAIVMVALLVPPSLWSQAPDWYAGMARVTVRQDLGIAPGSGFVVAIKGGKAFLLTAAHVVEGDPNPQVAFQIDPESPYAATILYKESAENEIGLAVLVIANPPSGVIALSESSQSASVPGTKVEVGGFPAALGGRFVPFETSATRSGRDLVLTQQTDKGYSGGPVIRDGAVVGLVYGEEAGFGKALESGSIRSFLEGNNVSWSRGGTAVASNPPSGPLTTRIPSGTRRVNPKDGLTYISIPAGTFMMGCSPGDNECDTPEKQAHQVTITQGFWIGQTPVTVGAYKRFAGTTGNQMPPAPSFNNGWTNENMPVVDVSWDDAKAYCRWIGGRLPTEAEWEYAARGGSTEARYGPIDEVAWYHGNSGGQTHDVAQKRANGFGLYDVLGNVWEWVNDWSDPNYYQNGPSQDPQGPTSGQYRILRGGSWSNNLRVVRVSYRNGDHPTVRIRTNGFRCSGGVFNP